jgi:5-methylcytosine-specific restriction enzyme subunit McrC
VNKLHLVLREWESVGPEDDGLGVTLRGFRFDDPAHRRLAKELTNAGTVRLEELYDGLRIETRSHIGRIQLGRLTLTILPKIGTGELLALFRYAYGLRDVGQLGVASYSFTGDLLQDLIIAQLHSEVRELLERGIARSYLEQEESLASPRGKIAFSRLAVQTNTNSARLPCRHHPRSTDHLLNRVVLAGLALAQYLAEDRGLRIAVSRQRQFFAQLTSVEELSGDLLVRARRKLNRLVAPYESIVQMIEILYFGNLLDLGPTQGQQRLPGFLFDMNRFFQRLMQRFLTDNLRGARVRVESEYGLTGMMRYVPTMNPRRKRAPTPRPDYAIMSKGRVLSLLDAKYRDLWEHSLPREMLYQLAIYALSQPSGSTSAILYPATDPGAEPSRIEVLEPSSGKNAGYVALRPVHLHRMVKEIADQRRATQMSRESWACQLAGIS